MWLLHFLPLSVLARSGAVVGLLLYAIAHQRRRIAHVNLELCFPEKSAAERRRLAQRHFVALARSILERGILRWSSKERIGKTVRVEGLQHWERVRHSRPVVLLAPHFVGIDMGGMRLSSGGWPLTTMYRRLTNPVAESTLRAMRKRFGGHVVATDEGFRSVIEVMRQGHAFYYLPDHDLGRRKAVFVPFFGVPAATVTALSRLVRTTGAIVVPCVTRQLPGGAGYVAHFYPPWFDYPLGDATADARRMNEFIEERVREMPEQYFWVHRRFKTLPEGGRRAY